MKMQDVFKTSNQKVCLKCGTKFYMQLISTLEIIELIQ